VGAQQKLQDRLASNKCCLLDLLFCRTKGGGWGGQTRGSITMCNMTGLQEFSTYLITVIVVSSVAGRTGSNGLTVTTQMAGT